MPGPKKRKADLLHVLAVVLLGACTPALGPEASPERTVIRIAHLHDYAWQDRSRTGQPVEFKPEAECQALYRSLRDTAMDILILRGVGSEAAFRELSPHLQDPATRSWVPTYLPGSNPFTGLGVVTRATSPDETQTLSHHHYEVKGVRYAPLAGGIRRQNLWIWNAVLPEPEADYECRRNETRMLCQALRPLIQDGRDVLLTLHSREEVDSPMFRLLEETGLTAVPTLDDNGDSWTHRDPEGGVYRRDQWIFATPGLAGRLQGHILDTPDIRAAGPFRHQQVILL